MTRDRTPVSALGLSLRIQHALHFLNVKTIGEAYALPEWDLYALPNFGRKSVADFKKALAAHREKHQEFIFHCSRCDFATDDSSKLVYAWDDAYSGERLADIFCPLCGAPVEEKPECA